MHDRANCHRCADELGTHNLRNESRLCETRSIRRKLKVMGVTCETGRRTRELSLSATSGIYVRSSGWIHALIVHADAELTHVPRQDCPMSKPSKIQHRQGFARSQTGSVKSQQLGQFGVGANTTAHSPATKNFALYAMVGHWDLCR
jgi:hypothetical protein